MRYDSLQGVAKDDDEVVLGSAAPAAGGAGVEGRDAIQRREHAKQGYLKRRRRKIKERSCTARWQAAASS